MIDYVAHHHQGGFGYVFYRNDRWYEVSARSEVSVEVPALVTILLQLHEMQLTTQALLNKIVTFAVLQC